LNQRCLLATDLESILRARMSKILLQQNQPTPAQVDVRSYVGY
jgi:hypothetical protein